MSKQLPLLGIVGALAGGAFIGWAGASHGIQIAGFPAFAIAVAVAFVIQWLAFVPAYLLQTERFFDLMGSLTFLAVTGWALGTRPEVDLRSLVIAVLIGLWAVRLGSFLFVRTHRHGDRRFRQIKPSLPLFLMTWTLQGLWVVVTASPALAAILSEASRPPDWTLFTGAGLWLLGFLIEVVADEQKRRFRSESANRQRPITTGLWSWSRHPNYFGEIVLWVGIAVIAAPLLEGWQLATLLSPIFVWMLLTKISGVRMLEVRANRIWRDDRDYQEYVRRTNVLFPMPPRRT